jgi:hypothetical protein
LPFFKTEERPMTNRVTYAPQDFQKMCRQAERDHESRKLVVLLERVKRQIAGLPPSAIDMQLPKPPVTAGGDSAMLRLPNRSVPLER